MSSVDCRLSKEEVKEEGFFIHKVNRVGRICMDYRDFGGGYNKNSLFDALPIVAVVGGQSSGKSSLLESIVGIELLPKGSSEFITRKPLVLHLEKLLPTGETVVQFSHLPTQLFYDLFQVRQEIENVTNGIVKQPHPSFLRILENVTNGIVEQPDAPIHLFIHSPDAINNLTLIDLPTLTNAKGVEKMVKTYINKPNCIILAVSPAAGQDLAKSNAMRLAREVDPSGQRTIGVLTGLDLMDEGTHVLDVLDGRAYPLDIPWVGVADTPHHDTDMMMYLRRRMEQEYFATSPHYAHLADRMGSQYLANLLLQRLESFDKALSIGSMMKRRICEMEEEPKRDQLMLLLYKSAQYFF